MSLGAAMVGTAGVVGEATSGDGAGTIGQSQPEASDLRLGLYPGSLGPSPNNPVTRFAQVEDRALGRPSWLSLRRRPARLR